MKKMMLGRRAGAARREQAAVAAERKSRRFIRSLSYHAPLLCDNRSVMAIPNVKRYQLTSPDGANVASVMAVLPKGADVDAYLKEASARFDWKAWEDMKQKQFKVRVGQQKQKKAK
jgi:hypothetical protein